MKQVTRSFVCGNSNATPSIAWCFPGDENCNNYCNHDHSKPMPDSPKTYDTIIWEEKDMWEDVITLIAEYVPTEGGPTVFELLMAKYEIKQKMSNTTPIKKIFTNDQLHILKDKGWNCDHHPPYKLIHFGWNSIEIQTDGKVIETYAGPVNVDPDDGSYNTKETIRTYRTFQDFIDRRQPESEKHKYLD